MISNRVAFLPPHIRSIPEFPFFPFKFKAAVALVDFCAAVRRKNRNLEAASVRRREYGFRTLVMIP
jgi:hypothetical protein